MNKTMYHELNISAGARMVEMFGYELPWEYKLDPNEEQRITRGNVGFNDIGYMAKFHVTGKGAFSFVQKVTTNDIATSVVGQVKYTAFCKENGNMVDDGTVWKYSDEDFMLITGDEVDGQWFEQQAKGFDIKIENMTFKNGTLQIQGPNAPKVIQKITGIDPASIKFFHFKETTLEGKRLIVGKLGFTGSGGFEFHMASEDSKIMWDAIEEAGKKFGIVPFGQGALEAMRQEAGYLLVGNDHNPTTNPLEVGIGQVVCFTKGNDFIGRSALEKIAREGADRRIVWFKIQDGAVANLGDKIFLEGCKVGNVTSGSFSYTTGMGTALGLIDSRRAFSGQNYTIITSDGASHSAIISLVPLYDPTRVFRSSIGRK